MKAFVLLFLTLFLHSQAQVVDWTGTWRPNVAENNECGPTGLINITQTPEGNATVKFKWAPYSSACKELQMAGKTTIATRGVADRNVLRLLFKTPNGTLISMVFARVKDNASKIHINYNTSADHEIDRIGHLYPVNDTSTLNEWEASYKFYLTKDYDEDCCNPVALKLTMVEPAIYAAEGKWNNSKSCERAGISGTDFSQVHVTVKPGEAAYIEQSVPNGKDVSALIFKTGWDHRLDYANSLNVNDKCRARIKKIVDGEDDSNPVPTEVIVGIIIAVVVVSGIIGCCIFAKKKPQRFDSVHDMDYYTKMLKQ